MIATAITCASALLALLIVRDLVLRVSERLASKPVLERLALQERALENVAIEVRAALVAQQKRMDELKAPQNHKAAAMIAGGLGGIAR